MHVRILAADPSDEFTQVRFEASRGTGLANWQGESVPPQGEELSVELDIEETIELGRTARLIESEAFSVSHSETTVTFRGLIEDQDDDGMAYLRIGEDCLIMVEAEDNELKGKWIELTVPAVNVELTPI